MKEKICVYTCITGEYDNLKEVEVKDKTVDFICFTNNENLTSKTWKIIQIKDPKLDNCRLARKIKVLGHPIVNKYDVAIWSDASVVWQKHPSDFIKTFLKKSPLAIFRHCSRDNIYDEAIACLKFRKDSKEIILKTLDYYKNIKYPDNSGLCESTVYIKKPKDLKVQQTMEIWFDMIKKYSRRDQLSFNYAAWKTSLDFKYIELNVWNNSWFRTYEHTPKLENTSCHVYFGNLDKEFDFDKYFIYEYQKSLDVYSFKTKIPIDTNQIEFYPAEVFGTDFKKITITPKPTKTEIVGSIDYGKNKAFFTKYNIIRIYGNFKKGQKLTFSIQMNIMDESKANKIIEGQLVQTVQLNNLLNQENKKLLKELQLAQTELHNVLNSKRWKLLEKLDKLLKFKH